MSLRLGGTVPYFLRLKVSGEDGGVTNVRYGKEYSSANGSFKPHGISTLPVETDENFIENS